MNDERAAVPSSALDKPVVYTSTVASAISDTSFVTAPPEIAVPTAAETLEENARNVLSAGSCSSRSDIDIIKEKEVDGNDSDCSGSSNSSNERETFMERHDWEPVLSILNQKLQQLLHMTLNPSGNNKLAVEDFQVVQRFNGGFNHIVMIKATKISHTEHYIIRIPAVGTSARWQEGDAHNTRCEMALLEHLQQNTTIPVPEAIAFDDTLKSCIGAPYCVMERLPGKPAHTIWFEGQQKPDRITANHISAETEAKRCNFLRSLAQAMAGLQALEFGKICAPDLEDGEASVTHLYRWTSPDEMSAEDLEGPGQIYQYGSFDSNAQYMTFKPDQPQSNTDGSDLADGSNIDEDEESDDDEDDSTTNYRLGVQKIRSIIHSHPTLTHSSHTPTTPESFVLRNPDLDLQNILVDPHGNVTGILDWENSIAVPRCVGFSSVPDFLRRDWRAGYSLTQLPHMTWQLEHHRQVYARAMMETGALDAKFTAKSATYRAVVDAYSEGVPADVVEKVLRCVPGLRLTDIEELVELVGKGCGKAEEYLEAEIGKVLDPET